MTPLDRRSFLKASCLAAWAGAFSAGHSLAATIASRFTRILPAALPLNPAEEMLLALVSRFGGDVRFVGQGVLDKLRGAATREAHLLVKITDATAFDATLAAPGLFTGAYSQGNTFSFVLGGVEFTVENLRPAAFDQRLLELATVKQIAFAQDALIYDPASLRLTDPFGAGKSATLKLVNTTIAGGAAIGVAVRGRLAAGRLGMKPGSVFANWQTRHLGLGASVRTARAVVEAFLASLATIANADSPVATKTLLGSRAVSTALNRVFGLKVADVIAKFDVLREEVSGETSNAALWLALLLGPEIESEAADGAATTWLQRGTRFEMLRSRSALAEARQFLKSNS